MQVWLCSLTRAAEPHTDVKSAVAALRTTLEREIRQGKSVRPPDVTDKVGQVYTVRGASGLERYWLTHEKPE
ncbi:MAG TPA: hypothetical protein VFR59_12955 [Steroidobacteraceae bacterium]|nr:hypothetical protein [Steroidobacteraceae bacterium]HEU4532095.1 hypothetical protein [Steroidobacteraceae bacterium]